MPLIRIDLFDQYSDENIKTMLDIIHKDAVDCFNIPKRDRYQIVTKHAKNEMVLLDTGLGFERTAKAISIQLFSRKRDPQAKLKFYHQVTNDLSRALDISGKDILISLVENGDYDWSFGFGEAQFVSGKL
ncbi:MAG: tautomerase family protein [Lactobacillus sp.]|uniref:Tautomerase family protein n=1 Tax=Bombilactobacillus bombi TaxID=1303590 RepID=A0A417ZI06_9LACO|nr:tautomerase family protein [Bombilactobacillus bombi]MCO6543353.1 tautomerase family protein [Lactobacillus sp.]RHW51205.1 tautomerase family protein [Bombilactobacillus bombi]